jgi:hypothetical protein
LSLVQLFGTMEDDPSSVSSAPTAAAAVTNEELSDKTIAEMIEVSFVQSCLQLSQGYIDVLKLFIVAVKAGYERSLSLTTLHTLVKNCSVESANRKLSSDEEKLRYEWMKMVYELLNAIQYKQRKEDDMILHNTTTSNTLVEFEVGKRGGEAGYKRISTIVQSMLTIQEQLLHEEITSGGSQDASLAMTKLTVEDVIQRSVSLKTLDESYITDPLGRAFLMNDIRVALVTFRVLEEERVCLLDSAGRTATTSNDGGGSDVMGEVPRPPIPGTLGGEIES